ncbi:MAG: recombinase family protein [Tannerellaceae bacterium]|nr:recombinase family protein [Tannerellaceae bacterium]
MVLTRVSTNKQDFDPQTNDLKDWATQLGYKDIYSIGTKESGFKGFDTKEGFRQVRLFVEESPEYRTILITELSRLSRAKRTLFKIKDWLEENKIQLKVKDISFDLFDEYGSVSLASDLTFTMFASMAESEMETKKLRFKRALKDLHKNGLSITGKNCLVMTEYMMKKVKRINL